MARCTTLLRKTQGFPFFRYGNKSDTLALITEATVLSYLLTCLLPLINVVWLCWLRPRHLRRTSRVRLRCLDLAALPYSFLSGSRPLITATCWSVVASVV